MNKSVHRSVKSSQVPNFVQKVLQIVTNEQIHATVSWTTTRDSFIIKDVPKFTDTVLPLYFKHHNFASFIRQLNMYGFKKIRHSDGENVYHNEYFREGGQHLLKNISRKLKDQKEQALALYNQSLDVKDQNKVPRQMSELKLKQSSLEEMCKHFLKQNQRLLQQNNSFLKRMQHQTVQKETRIEQFLIELLAKKSAIALPAQNSKMLSITNQAHPVLLNSVNKEMTADQSQTPLQVLSKILDGNKQIKKMKEMISSSYANKDSLTTKKNKNYTIINRNSASKAESYQAAGQQGLEAAGQQGLEEGNFFDDYASVKELPLSLKPLRSQSQGFLSINQFLNADECSNYSNIDLSV